MYVENGWLSLDPIYLSLLHTHKFSDMDGFQDGGYIWAQGVLSYHLIKVPWYYSLLKKICQDFWVTKQDDSYQQDKIKIHIVPYLYYLLIVLLLTQYLYVHGTYIISIMHKTLLDNKCYFVTTMRHSVLDSAPDSMIYSVRPSVWNL